MSHQHPTPARAKLAIPRPQAPPPTPERISGPALAKERLLDDIQASPHARRRPQLRAAVVLGAAAPKAPTARAVAARPMPEPSAPSMARPAPSDVNPQPNALSPGFAAGLEAQLAARAQLFEAELDSVGQPPSLSAAAPTHTPEPVSFEVPEVRGHDKLDEVDMPRLSAAARGLGAKAEFRPRSRPAKASSARPVKKAASPARRQGAMRTAADAFMGLLVLWGEEFERHIVGPVQTLWSSKGAIAGAIVPVCAPLILAYLCSLNDAVAAAFLSGDRVSRLGGWCFLYVVCAFVWVFAWMILGRLRSAFRVDLNKLEQLGRSFLNRRD
jgi:hypothetical protein